MKFLVEQALGLCDFDKFGLETMAVTKKGEFIKDRKIIEQLREEMRSRLVYADRDEIAAMYSEVEINTLDELIDFENRVGPIIINDEASNEKLENLYEKNILIYNYYIE